MEQEAKQLDPNALYKAIEDIIMDGKQPTPRMANEIMNAIGEVLNKAYGEKGEETPETDKSE